MTDPTPTKFTLDAIKPKRGLLTYVSYETDETEPTEFFNYFVGLDLSEVASIIRNITKGEMSLDHELILYKTLMMGVMTEIMENKKQGNQNNGND